MIDGTRSSRAKERIEWQADFYASCLLIPPKMVFAAWNEAFPDRRQRVLQRATPIDHPFAEIARDFDANEGFVHRRIGRRQIETFVVLAHPPDNRAP